MEPNTLLDLSDDALVNILLRMEDNDIRNLVQTTQRFRLLIR